MSALPQVFVLPVPQREKLLVTVPELLANPAKLEWLVRDFLEKQTLGMLFGAPASGKSFVGLALAASVSTGTEFLGRQVAQGGVIYVAGEGHAGIARRLKAWELHTGRTIPDSFTLSRRAVQFLSPDDVFELEDEISDLPEPPALICIDTVARAMSGGDENSSKEMGSFVAACDHLKRRFNTTLLLIHHVGHGETGRARGSSALKAALDFEASVTNQAGSRCITITKMKDAEEPPATGFELMPVELPWLDEDGSQVSSAVIVESDAPSQKQKMLSPSQRKGIAAYCLALDEGQGTLSDDGDFLGLHVDQWRKYFHQVSDAGGYEAMKKAFQRSRRDLIESGLATVSDDIYRINEPSVTIREASFINAAKQGDTGHLGDIRGTCPDQ